MGVDLAGEDLALAYLRSQIPAEGEGRAGRPALMLPQARADEGLGAVEEALRHREPDRHFRRLAARTQPLEQRRIHRELCFAADPQGLGIGRYDEEKPDMRVGEDVLQTEEEIVARAVGNEQRLAILDQDEARIIALG